MQGYIRRHPAKVVAVYRHALYVCYIRRHPTQVVRFTVMPWDVCYIRRHPTQVVSVYCHTLGCKVTYI